MNFSIELEDAQVKAALAEAIKLGINMTPITQAWAAVMVSQTRLSFSNGESPDGQIWAPLKVRKGRPLRDTGLLMNSITGKYNAHESIVGASRNTPDGASIAAVHQFGATIHAKNAAYLRFPTPSGWAMKKSVTIPARPFFPKGPNLPTSWSKPLIEAAETRIGKAFGQ